MFVSLWMCAVLCVLCRYDAVVRRHSDSASLNVSASVADYSAVTDSSHTKQCIIHTDISSDVTSVCGVLLPRIQSTRTLVRN